MNMNQYNQVTAPQLALMNAIMAAMQTQPQLQSAGGGVPNTVNGLTMPQQAAFPNFLLQAPQLPQTVPAPSSVPQFGGQPWALPALQTVNAPQPSGSQSKAPANQPSTVDEIVAGVVAAMKAGSSTPPQAPLDKSITARFAPEDERILINALRKAKAEGLTPLQGISKLDQVNDHTTAAWKDYFIKHVEKLAPRVYQQAYANAPASASSKSVASGSRSGGPSAPPSLPRRPVTNGNASDSERSSPDEDTAVGGSVTSRSKRGAPVVEYHGETCIPYLLPGIKPKAPRRDPQPGNLRFTKEDKIFFIHYLKYRLHKGPVPSKEQLYRELAKQAPHHNAESWKRHWDYACRLPNEIYIQARKRVNSSQQEPGRTAPRPQESETHVAESSEEEEESGDEQEDGDAIPSERSDDAVREPPVSRTPASAVTARKGRGGRRSKITDGEIRAMARYIVDKRKCEGWESLPAHIRWAEFANRAKNKRTVKGWIQITYTRSEDVNAYVQEYEAEEAQTSAAEEKPSGSPTVDRTANPQRSKVRQMKGTTPCSKRGLEDEGVKSEREMSSNPKRLKLAEPEAIVISD